VNFPERRTSAAREIGTKLSQRRIGKKRPVDARAGPALDGNTRRAERSQNSVSGINGHAHQ
jgi:hypothetical protein